jgi:uncharacterized protein YlxW (UPF0749 family)
MKSNRPLKHRYIVLIIAVASILLVHIAGIVTAETATPVPVTSEPGTDGDPVITQSYVDKKVGDLGKEIDSLKAKLDTATTAITELQKKVTDLTTANDELGKQIKELQPDTMKFKPLQVKAGQKLIAGESAEIILRSGKATALAGTYGGLSDITAASSTDIKTGDNIL